MALAADRGRDPESGAPSAVRQFYLFTLLERVLVNSARLVRHNRRPLCPDSDQVPHRSEMSRCANTGRGFIRSPRRRERAAKKSGSSDIASKMRYQTPLMLQRLKRRNTLFQSPNVSGRSRHGEPVRTIQSTPSTNILLSRPVEPFWSGRPMISGAIRSHAASLKTNRSITPKAASPKAVLNLICWQKGILKVHGPEPLARSEARLPQPGQPPPGLSY